MGWVKILPKSNPSRDHHVEVDPVDCGFQFRLRDTTVAASDRSVLMAADRVVRGFFQLRPARCGLPSVTQRVEVAPPLKQPEPLPVLSEPIRGQTGPSTALVRPNTREQLGPVQRVGVFDADPTRSSVDAAAPSGRSSSVFADLPCPSSSSSLGPTRRHQIPSRWTKSFLSSCAHLAQTQHHGTDPAAHTNTRSPRSVGRYRSVKTGLSNHDPKLIERPLRPLRRDGSLRPFETDPVEWIRRRCASCFQANLNNVAISRNRFTFGRVRPCRSARV